jgi:hypothetical protein
MNEVFINSYGKKVKITYIPWKYFNLTDGDVFKTADGVIENLTSKYIYIKNNNDCFEIFQLRQILEMVEV